MNWDISTEEGMDNAIAWQEDMVNRIKEGGSWIVPRSGTIYTINHVKRTATYYGLLPEPTIEKVFNAMGWRVIYDV